ncbi:hypothetical protein PV327_001593 [Microctonus hyperodae]|uniref:Uncharacterized protein n=1 Tax=Microctonus hyperodae TaxID=165561 RepID=A0AA39FDZ4_MICHY|nr:hypothetical protein PV327_001593 [Microctonus hyperodae]
MAATKIVLYDSEKDIAVEAYVSGDEAERAKTDIFFATQLLRSVMEQEQEQEPPASTSITTHVEHDENTAISPIDEEPLDEETTETQESEDSAEETSDSTAGSDSGCSTKSNKTSIATLFQKRIRQKDEHEENKKKRHKETMEIFGEFLKVLKKSAEK